MNYVFYDYETTGRSSTWDQVIQVGAILVNDEFQRLDTPFEARCGLKPGLVPEPGALLVNRTTPDMLRKTNLSHYEMTKQLIETFKKWSPAIFIGYNNLSFDSEFTRKTLFKNLFDPYIEQYFENEEGKKILNKRADILGLVRSAHLYYPDCIKTPISDKGNAVFKLDELAPMNGIELGFHDAVADCQATIGIAKIIKDKAPNVWKSSLMTASKSDVDRIVQDEKVFCFNEYFYGKARPYVCTLIGFHPKYNWPQCFDLKEDPTLYFNMSTEELKAAMKKTPKFYRSCKNNKHPVIMSPNYGERFDGYKQLGLKKLHERADLIKANEEFKNKFLRILQEEAEEKDDLDSQLDIHAEESIYKGGFASDSDKAIMRDFHKADWKDRLSLSDKFKDSRFNYFAKRLIYEENPTVLPTDLYNEIHRKIAEQILSTNNEKWNTIPKARNELVNKQVELEEKNDLERLDMMEDMHKMYDEIEKKYEKA